MKNSDSQKEIVLDARGLECPIPVLKARKLAQNTKNPHAPSEMYSVNFIHMAILRATKQWF